MNNILAPFLLLINQVGHEAADTTARVAEHTAEQGAPEFPNIIEILHKVFPGHISNILFQYRIIVFSTIVWLILGILAYMAYRKRALILREHGSRD